MNEAREMMVLAAQQHALNTLYLLVALCVAYKLAFIIRQVAQDPSPVTWMLRGAAAVVATIIIFKAMGRFHGGDAAEWLDIAREFSWCLFLAASIVMLQRKLGHW